MKEKKNLLKTIAPPAAARILSCGVVNNNKGMHAKLLKT